MYLECAQTATYGLRGGFFPSFAFMVSPLSPPPDPNLDQAIGQQNYLENLWKLCNVEGPYAFHSEYCIFRKSQVITPLAIMPSDIGIHMFLY